VWYAELAAVDILAAVPHADRAMTAQEFERAARHDQLGALAHLTHMDNGQLRFVERPPLVTPVTDQLTAATLSAFYGTYKRSLRPDLRDLLDRYTYVDAVRKVVGVGSVGTRCFVVLLIGRDARDPLFLQVKEARRSVLEPYVGPSPFANSGERVVNGQRRVQAASDIFLGWGEQNGVHYYVRQLRDMKGSINLTNLKGGRLEVYAGLCGWALARAHARSGDAARLSGYIGKSDALDNAITRFAERYADQTERDHAVFVSELPSPARAEMLDTREQRGQDGNAKDCAPHAGHLAASQHPEEDEQRRQS
jgi:uncharacterized protein (DUF2252 family)